MVDSPGDLASTGLNATAALQREEDAIPLEHAFEKILQSYVLRLFVHESRTPRVDRFRAGMTASSDIEAEGVRARRCPWLAAAWSSTKRALLVEPQTHEEHVVRRSGGRSC